MSLLAPLYALGLLAVSLPIVLHLIRRVPRGRYSFSSLMFLSPSPPRLTRRSRLDHLLLLFLRGLALTLLALAFARPFLRDAINLSMDDLRGRQVAIVVDTSASMRRGDLWQQATARLERTFAGLEPADDVALFAFDAELRSIVPFEDQPLLQRAGRVELIRRRFAELRPTWSHTELGEALASVADTLQIVGERRQAEGALQIVLISDMQRGAAIEALQAIQWPEEVLVAIESVARGTPSNASLRLLDDDESGENRTGERVRVVNAADSTSEQFHVAWHQEAGPARREDAMAVYVPPGQSRVVRMPRPDHLRQADRLVLQGDTAEFDNTLYAATPAERQWNLVYVGRDKADDPEGLLYYLQLAYGGTRYGTVQIVSLRGDEPASTLAETEPQLLVISEAVGPQWRQWLQTYLQDGGALLIVPATREAAVALVSFTGKAELTDAADVAKSDYVMLGDIDFTHPIFAALASPRYSDFTKIHFWHHYPISVQDDSTVRVLARFDNGDPALWEQSVGRGRLFVLTSGWRPRDSQLGLSSKFVPLLNGVLEQAAGGQFELPNYTVGHFVPLPPDFVRDAAVVVRKPDGTQVEVPSGSLRFDSADQPGIYEASRSGESFRFAINLSARESDTAPLDVERLEQLGVQLGDQPPPTADLQRRRQLRDIELEGRQKLWRWLIALGLVVLMVETWWAGVASRKISSPVEES